MQRRLVPSLSLAAAIALAATAFIAAPASAAADRARFTIAVMDLAGQPVVGFEIVVRSSVSQVHVTTNEWGKANVRVYISPGDTVTVEPWAPALEPVAVFEGVEDSDRLDVEFTAPIAQGFDTVLTYHDLTGDGLWDTALRKDNVGAQDDWIVLGGDGSVATTRFAYYPIDGVLAADTDGLPGQELVALERQPDGTTHVWSYNPVTGSEEYVDAGVLPSTDWAQDDFDGDGRKDLLFSSIWATAGGLPFTIVEADGDVFAFHLGGPDSWFDGEFTDVTGDGLKDVYVSQVIPGQTIRWHVWESDDSSVHTKDMGTHGEIASSEGVLDGDNDGLVEFIGAFEVPGDDRGWEVLEYASGDYFEVILGPEDDRGPSSVHYPASWFTP